MDVKLQELLIQYRSLVILSNSEKDIKIKPKWLKKLRKEIISHLDTELTFVEFYNILKSVEKDGFGFYVKPRRTETLLDNEKKVIHQDVEVGMNYMGGKTYAFIEDTNFSEIVEENIRVHVSKQIKPSEIISISNSEILYKIMKINKKLYKHIFGYIIDALYQKVDSDFKQDYLQKNLRDCLSSYGILEVKYGWAILDMLFEENKNLKIV